MVCTVLFRSEGGVVPQRQYIGEQKADPIIPPRTDIASEKQCRVQCQKMAELQ